MEFRRGNRVYEFLIYWLLIAGACSAAPVVRKVEPPNWWTGHSLNPVRVLVRLHPWLGVTGWLEVRNGRALITLPARSAEMYSAMGP